MSKTNPQLFKDGVDYFISDETKKLMEDSFVHAESKIQGFHDGIIDTMSLDEFNIVEKNKISLIATELEIINNKITGNLISTNCFGPEKVKRILKSYDLLNYDCIYAYGNSRGDHEMLELATEKFYKPFR